MIDHLWLFVGIAAVAIVVPGPDTALVIVVPGPDTALVTKNAVLHGRRAAGRRSSDGERARRAALDGRGGFRQGLLSDLANPKIGAFFTGLLPQFAGPGHAVLVPFLVLGGLFVLMTAVWLSGYALVAVKASELLRRPRVSAVIDRLSGVILIGFGIRLALERR